MEILAKLQVERNVSPYAPIVNRGGVLSDLRALVEGRCMDGMFIRSVSDFTLTSPILIPQRGISADAKVSMQLEVVGLQYPRGSVAVMSPRLVNEWSAEMAAGEILASVRDPLACKLRGPLEDSETDRSAADALVLLDDVVYPAGKEDTLPVARQAVLFAARRRGVGRHVSYSLIDPEAYDPAPYAALNKAGKGKKARYSELLRAGTVAREPPAPGTLCFCRSPDLDPYGSGLAACDGAQPIRLTAEEMLRQISWEATAWSEATDRLAFMLDAREPAERMRYVAVLELAAKTAKSERSDGPFHHP